MPKIAFATNEPFTLFRFEPIFSVPYFYNKSRFTLFLYFFAIFFWGPKPIFFTNFGLHKDFVVTFPLAPMGVLAPGSAHA